MHYSINYRLEIKSFKIYEPYSMIIYVKLNKSEKTDY